MSVFASQLMIRSTVSRVMISLRFGPAFTWQCTQVRLQSLPTLTWRISGRARRSEIDFSLSLCANRFIPELTATIARPALVGLRRIGFLSLKICRKHDREIESDYLAAFSKPAFTRSSYPALRGRTL